MASTNFYIRNSFAFLVAFVSTSVCVGNWPPGQQGLSLHSELTFVFGTPSDCLVLPCAEYPTSLARLLSTDFVFTQNVCMYSKRPEFLPTWVDIIFIDVSSQLNSLVPLAKGPGAAGRLRWQHLCGDTHTPTGCQGTGELWARFTCADGLPVAVTAWVTKIWHFQAPYSGADIGPLCSVTVHLQREGMSPLCDISLHLPS